MGRDALHPQTLHTRLDGGWELSFEKCEVMCGGVKGVKGSSTPPPHTPYKTESADPPPPNAFCVFEFLAQFFFNFNLYYTFIK